MRDATPPFDAHELLAHAGWVRRLARRLVQDPDLAEDLVQDTWAAALDRPPRHAGNLRGWLGRILRNFVRGRHRRESVRREKESVRTPPRVPTPEELVLQASRHRQLVGIVLELEEPYRATLLHRYFAEKTPTEIARDLGIPASTVRIRLKRGLERVREALERRESGDSRRWLLAFLAPSFAPSAPALPRTAAAAKAALPSVFIGALVVALPLLALLLLTEAAPRATPEQSFTTDPSVPPNAGRAEDLPRSVEVRPFTPPATIRLRGRVLDASGRPVVGARIIAFPADRADLLSPASLADDELDELDETRTDAAGRFALGPPEAPGELAVLAVAEDLAPRVVTTHTLDARLSIRLTKGRRATGRLVGSAERPLADATVVAHLLFDGVHLIRTARTDAEGRWTIAHLPTEEVARGLLGALDFRVVERAPQRIWLAPSRWEGTTTHLRRGVRISGRVQAAGEGQGLPGATVVAFHRGGPLTARRADGESTRNPLIPWVSHRATTDATGRFQLEGIPDSAPDTTEIGAFAPGFHPVTRSTDGVGRDCILRCRQAVALTGRVVDERGEALEGVAVHLADGRMEWMLWPEDFQAARGTTRTGPDGCYRFPSVPRTRGSVRVRAYREDLLAAHFPTFDVALAEGDDDEILLPDLVYPRGGRLDLRVRDERGRALAGATVAMAPPGLGLEGSGRARTDREGRATLRFPERGPKRLGTRLFVFAPGRALEVLPPWDPARAPTQERVIRLLPEHLLEGRVLLPDDEVLRGGIVAVAPRHEAIAEVFASPRIEWNHAHPRYAGLGRVGTDGRFRIRHLGRGPFNVALFARTSGGISRHVLTDIRPGDDPLVFDLRTEPPAQPASRLAIRLDCGDGGDARRGFSVRIEQEGRPPRVASTTEERLEVAGLAAGPTRLHLELAGRLGTLTREHDLAAGDPRSVETLVIAVEPAFVVAGRAEGLPPTEDRITRLVVLDPETGATAPVEIAEDGAFELPRLAAGGTFFLRAEVVHATHRRHFVATRPLLLPLSGGAPRVRPRFVPGGVLEVQFVPPELGVGPGDARLEDVTGSVHWRVPLTDGRRLRLYGPLGPARLHLRPEGRASSRHDTEISVSPTRFGVVR